ncbi:MAG: HEAT repeat domain-containing protein [Candidatus Brocadiae bacterium]|nr:HEAT repeat domain-containing protein [Candidatus Brocadiia bacterium]
MRLSKKLFLIFFIFLCACSSFNQHLQKLKSESAIERCEAIQWLYFNVKTQTSEKLLVDALEKDQSMIVRSLAARIMALEGRKEFIPLLEKALYDENPLVRMEAVQSLGSLKSKSSIPKLTELLLKDPDLQVRLKVLKSIQYMQSEEETTLALIDSLDDQEASVRFHSLLLLEKSTKNKFGSDKESWKKWYQANLKK